MSLDRSSARRAARFGLLAVALLAGAEPAVAQVAPHPATQPLDLSTLDLEQLMRLQVVVAASKRAQNVRDVASFVTVVTAAEIREHGYRTIADVLKSLSSFYVTNDRNYSFIGVRGFDRPGDYGSRVLMLLNGLRTNDNIYDQAYIGQEFVVDVDVIERIEVIRGPSAAIYGSNAFFAVINVVTKRGGDVDGVDVSTSAASFNTYGGRVTFGKSLSGDLDVLLSATYSDSKGQSLYYPEYDKPATNEGVTNGADRESYRKLFATLTKGSFSFQASNSSREKGIPTGAFGTLFGDTRNSTVDGLSIGSLTYSKPFAQGSTFSTRLHAGRWEYTGSYAYESAVIPNHDSALGEWWGVDVDASHALFARHFLTVGAEYRDNFTQQQLNYDPEPYTLYVDTKHTSQRFGMFAQDEVKLFRGLTLSAGVRYDHYGTFGAAISPRVGFVYNPDNATTVKLLFGRAFRAPNEYELYYDGGIYKGNPSLQPEHIETLELVVRRMIGGGVQLRGVTFRNRISSLLSQKVDTADNDRLVVENLGEIRSNGGELGLTMNRGHGPAGQLTYSLQKSEDRSNGTELTNSPRHMIKGQLRIPLTGHDLTAGMDAQYMSSVKTLAGLEAKSYVVANLSVLARHVLHRLELGATLYNLFDARYGSPGSDEHRQDVIAQDGRNFRVTTTLHF